MANLARLWAWGSVLLAMVGPGPSEGAEAKKPRITAKPLAVVVNAGQKAEGRVEVDVEPGFHIQANPASQPSLIATTLFVEGGGGVRVGQPVYPTGKPYRQPGSPQDIMTFDGRFSIGIPLQADATAKAGERKLAGKFRYQACNDRICHMPETVNIQLPLTVKASK